ncbi:MAG TPA: GNAT family N-acetyltransferase [Phycisphaerae bacterium]|nr:GNAT family N-acetyltransferase [Phycisphaerae bacterium]HRW54990.1 GNAT family N-acetyltransferase [Phycisphaerae bacterium]
MEPSISPPNEGPNQDVTHAPSPSSPEPINETVQRVAESWYVAPSKPAPRGWPVYTLDFVLATLQRCVSEPEKVRRTAGWMLIGRLVRAGMAIAQSLIMLVAWTPVFSSLLETFARVYTRNAFGFFLRACYWKAHLRYLGQDTIIDQYTEIWGASSVSIGSRCHIDTNVRLAAGERRHGQHGYIRIGSHVHLGPGVHIAGRGGVRIGNFVGVMANAHLYSATGVIVKPSDPGQLISMSHMAHATHQHIVEGPIEIGEYAMIGMSARLMPNIRIGRGAIVHAGCEVTGDVQPFANFGGLPRGRRIGWRKPARKSPKWKPHRAIYVAPDGGPTIREITDPEDHHSIDGVLDLHLEAFHAGITTRLGREFVQRYYDAMICEPDCSLWIAELDGRVVGFLGCTTNRHHFEAANRSGATRFLAAWRFVTFRLSPIAVLRALRKQSLSRDYPDEAELLSIVVAPDARRLGLGKRFLDIWRTELEEAGLASYIVFTDNPEGINFYEKYGGEKLFKFNMRDKWSACYRFRAENLPSADASQREATAT